MGVHKNGKLEQADRRREKQGSALRGGLVTGRGEGGATEASWGEVSPDAIAAAIDIVAKLRGAIRFGVSRDGAVYGITVYLGDESETFWGRDVEAVTNDLHTIYQWAEQKAYEKGLM